MSERTSAVRIAEPQAAVPAEPAAWHAAGAKLRLAGYGLGPVVLLGLLVLALLRFGPLGIFETAFPPVEELTIDRITLPAPNLMHVRVVNGGPEPVTVAQVLVDEAAWVHEIDGPRRIERLENRLIRLPYPWVAGEPHAVTLVSSTGVTFTGAVAVATQTPRADARYLGSFALLGIYVGVVPVLVGLLWLPYLRRIAARWLDFFLAFTVGLLVFLGADALGEAFETAAAVAGAYQGPGLVLLGFLGAALLLGAAGRSGEAAPERSRPEAARPDLPAAMGKLIPAGGPAPGPMYLATLIALGIGLHNLGEGLAVGSAYGAGEVALGTFLVLGFLIHNTTEGLAIVAPLARGRVALGRLIGLGLLAGAPAIAGAWLGGLAYSPVLTTLFFAVGAGAIAQVVWVIGRALVRAGTGGLVRPLPATGFMLGLVVMYATGLLVAA